MSDAATLDSIEPNPGDNSERLHSLSHTIEHLAHLLPTQSPIRAFVHHNTLHAFQDHRFDEAARLGISTYGCQPYLREDRYRQELARGRILPQDLSAVLEEELGSQGDHLIGFLGTRYRLRLAMLQHPLRLGTDAELRWLVAETDAVQRFRSETPEEVRAQMIDATRRWVMRDLRREPQHADQRMRGITTALFERFGESTIEQWSSDKWEAFTLHLLWHICHDGVHGVRRFAAPAAPPVRHRDLLLEATGTDTDRLVNEVLIRYCAAFLDQGVAHWTLPGRGEGFFRAWLSVNRGSRPVAGWLRGLPAEIERIERAGLTPLEVIDESLYELGVPDSQREEYISQTLLALRGWAGMMWQMETNAEWTVHPAPAGSLLGYLAVRLILERLAVAYVARTELDDQGSLRDLRSRLHKKIGHAPRVSVDQRAFLVFQLAQTLGWIPEVMHYRSKREWSNLVEEIEAFSSIQRRAVYQLALERRYRTRLLDAIIAHSDRAAKVIDNPAFQVFCCLDEREESFRRHLEEVAPDCETFGIAGFFGVAMYYRGAADAHYAPLCPVVIKPRHYVQEEVMYSFEGSHRRRAETRRAIGKTSHWLHTVSRSVIGGSLTAILGSLASIPLVARVLFPRLTARILRLFGHFVRPPMTRLLIERAEETPGPDAGHLGYSLEEMINISQQVLQDTGLTTGFSRLVIIIGHGSSSLNNPHAAAYNCGACGGGRGGPNARAIAGMLSDPRVRERLRDRGLEIPRETVFIGAYHNTCDDSVEYLDLGRLPSSHREDFETALHAIDEACRRNAHERCRRFLSAELSMSEDAALRHVQARSEDLSQVRPEYLHATNAVCFVGRRERTKGLFLDRRTFLTSYDPTQDNAEAGILLRILQAAIPVCAGINLEYYFSHVDPAGYGCGSKLPHNITSLLGVMEGAASDLRPGLSWQMVEIHEPIRIIFIIETTPALMQGVMDRHALINELVTNEWVQLATLSPDSQSIHVYRRGRFEPYEPENLSLPVVKSSIDWYRGWRDHLGFASIIADGPNEKHRRDF